MLVDHAAVRYDTDDEPGDEDDEPEDRYVEIEVKPDRE